MIIPLLTIYYIAISTLPTIYLIYYPFRDNLRFRKLYVVCGVLIISALELYCALSVALSGNFLFIKHIDGIRLIFFYIYFVYTLITIKENFFKHSFSYMVVIIFYGLISPFIAFFEKNITGTKDLLIVNSILMTVGITIFVIVGIRFQKRIILPIMKNTDLTTVKACTAITFFIITCVYIPTWDLMWLKKVPIYYSVIRFAGAAETAFTTLLFKKIMNQQKFLIELTKKESENEKIMALSEEHFNSLKTKISETRRMSHDFKHLLILIENLIQNGKKEEVLTLLEKTDCYAKFNTIHSFSRDYDLNIIFSHYYEKALAKDIEIKILCDVPSDISKTVGMDLWILVGNLLNNAIEANNRIDSGEKKIHMAMRSKGSLLTVLVSNTFNPDSINLIEGEFITSKNNNNCGNGINSIKLTAEKYNGLAEFKIKGTRFIASVYMYL